MTQCRPKQFIKKFSWIHSSETSHDILSSLKLKERKSLNSTGIRVKIIQNDIHEQIIFYIPCSLSAYHAASLEHLDLTRLASLEYNVIVLRHICSSCTHSLVIHELH